MKKQTVFKNRLFYYLLIGFITALLIYNIYIFIKMLNVFVLLPIALQLTLLTLIFSKNQYARIGILVWASIALLIGSGLDIIGSIMDIPNNLIDNISSFPVESYIFNLTDIAIGILIISYTRRTVLVIASETEPD
ncbi:MAG TPA: hypothetical protein VHC47_13395 [Mucilaginibacter sp.]|nr:hypothetical protein [Mucilaginibacter sp.]